MSDLSKRLSKLTPEQRELLQKKLAKSTKKKEKIEPRPDQSVFEMSSAQKRLWFLNQMDPDSVFYNIPSAIRLHGQIDIKLLKESINTVIKRHEVLRSYYITNDKGEPEQKIETGLEIDLNLIEISSSSLDNLDREIQIVLKKEAAKSFDIDKAPLLNASLITIASDDHVLCLNMHHIIADGWSIGIFIHEITHLIQNHYSTSIPLPELSLQFADYAWWQSQQINKEKVNQQLEYWKTALKGMPSFLELRTDYSRPSAMTANGKHHIFSLDQQTSDAIKNLGRQNQVSTYAVLMAAFQVFLYKISGQEDFGVGAPIANRNRKEVENLIGFFVNTIVLRAQFENDITFNSLVKRISNSVAEASDNQDVPFDKIVESLVPKRELSYSPLFQVMFDYQSAPVLGSKELKVDILDIEIDVAKFDLLLLMTDTPDGIKCTFEYNTDLFATSTIKRFGVFFSTLLKTIIVDPAQKVSQLSLISESEKNKIIYDWNRTECEYPSKDSVSGLFEKQVQKTPDAIAITYGENSVNYFRLNENANKLAHYLVENGIEKGAHIALYMDRSIEMITAFIAILKAGGAYIPLDTSYPKERLAFMLEDSNAVLLLTQEKLANELPDTKTRILNIDNIDGLSRTTNTTNPGIRINSDEKAYIIYTSGSTGKPKGVIVPHKGISRLVLNTDYINLTEKDIISQISNASFDAATFEIWSALLNGSKLVGIKKETLLSTSSFLEEIKRQEINTILMTTAYFNQIVNEVPDAFKTINTVMFGGEAADPISVYNMYKNGPPERLLNVYGPTENTTYSTAYEIKDPEQNVTNIPIGKPINNSTCYVLDKNLKVVPVGVPGELYVGGDGLALGYHNRNELTNERFIPHLFSTEPGAKMYKTGDLVTYSEDGNIEFLGRIDQQVKLRGFRIELGEIESNLKNHPKIDESIVLARKNKNDEIQLVAYIVSKSTQGINPTTIKTFLLESLPDYMVPVIYINIDKIPHTPNGKIDRKALPDPENYRPAVENKYIAARNDLEKLFVSIWKDILGINQVGVYDNFFDIGGNSLKAAVFTNRVQKEFNETMHVGTIFKAPTIAELSMYINEYFPEKIKKYFGEIQQSTDEYKISVNEEGQIEKLNPDDLDRFSSLIQPLEKRSGQQNVRKSKNPRAVFLLSPPRSGSTLMRVMLAGNNNLFSPPELDLLTFNTLQERKNAFSKDGLEIWLESPIQAIMEAKSCDVEKAKAIMAGFEKQKMSVKDFYFEMQNWLTDKLIVDKTPTYAFDPNILKRMEEDFEDPLYIHLVRHPYAMIYSFIEAKLDQNFFRHKHPFSRRELAELIWIISNRNIVQFLQSVPKERQVQIRFEDVLADPKSNVKNLCDFLNIEFSNDMLKPYEGKKMTDGISENSQMVGDFKFYLHKNINSTVADKWRTYHSTDFLSDSSWEIAEQFGYTVEKTIAHDKERISEALDIIPKSTKPELSLAQQRLWFINQLKPGTAQYNVPGGIQIEGKLNPGLLHKTFNIITSRHETLRSTFKNDNGQAKLSILDHVNVPFEFVDFSSMDSENLEEKIKAFGNKQAAMPFKLSEGPLLKAVLIKKTEQSHALFLFMHHIISDGWSINVLFKEWVNIYNMLVNGQTVNLPALPIQYSDYASWQKEWLSNERVINQQHYWKNKLANTVPLLELPIDRPRVVKDTYAGKSIIFRWDKSLTSQLEELSKQFHSTIFMTLLAAFKILLYRYSGQEDISVGTPVANRVRKETEPLIGFFVNTLVLRDFINPNHSFEDVLKEIMQTSIEAFDNQDIPFEKLVNMVDPDRSMSNSPLFQVMFAMQSSELETLEIPGLKIAPLALDSGTAKFDLTLTMVERYDELRGQLEYKTDLFDSETIENLLENFEKLVRAIINNSNIAIGQLPILGQNETHDQIAKSINIDPRPKFSKPFKFLFEEQVSLTPSNTALKSISNTEDCLTYANLNNAANHLAIKLINKGIKPDTLVGLYFSRSPEMIIALLAVIKSGAAYLPIDPDYPDERINYIIDDSGVSLILTHDKCSASIQKNNVELIFCDAAISESTGKIFQNPELKIDPDHLAYMIYTSGSTGKPKGTLITQKGLTHYLNWVYKSYPLHKGQGSIVHSPLAFDATVTALFSPLISGKSVSLAGNQKDIDALSTALQNESQFSLIKITPAHLDLLSVQISKEKAKDVTSAFVIGGENLDENQIKFWKENAPGTSLFNEYGPTETVVGCIVFDAINWSGNGSVPIGRAITNTPVYLLDEYLNHVPKGISGEIYIGGDGLARGYHNRPALSADRFIPDPFSKTPGSRMYKTGDIARYLNNDQMIFLGRVDSQIKVRGYRIELGEIENVLLKHPIINEVVVSTFARNENDKVLSAWYVSKDGAITTAELKDFLLTQLPDYMIPVHFEAIDSIPLTTNGKVDFKALPEPIIKRDDLESTFEEAQNSDQEILLQIWQGLLNTNKIGIHDNFFELGGDSILSIQVIARAAQKGLRITPRQIFDNPTIEKLALVADETIAINAEQGLLKGDLKLSPIQEWFFELDFSEPNHWNQSIMLEVSEPLDTDKMETTIQALLQQHDALRMKFNRKNDSWEATYSDATPASWEIIDLSATSNIEKAVADQANKLQASLDIENGKLSGFAYFKTPVGNKDILFITIHHLVIDGISWRILMNDLGQIYNQLKEGKGLNLYPKSTSYRYWVEALYQYIQKDEIIAQLKHWLEFTRTSVTLISETNNINENTENSLQIMKSVLEADYTKSLLTDALRVYNLEVNDILLTALARTVKSLNNSSNLYFAMEGHGREDLFGDVDISRTVGWFTSIFPVNLVLGASTDRGENIKAIKEQIRKTPNKGFDYNLLKYLGDNETREKMSTIPDPQITFNYLGQFDQSNESGMQFNPIYHLNGPERGLTNTRTHLLDISASVQNNSLTVQIGFSKSNNKQETIQKLLDGFITELKGLIDHCCSIDSYNYTPSDFSEANLDQDDLDDLLADFED